MVSVADYDSNNNKPSGQEENDHHMKTAASPVPSEPGEETEPQSPRADQAGSTKSQLANCWACMANFCIRTYECMYDACCSAWEWSAEHMCSCCRDEDYKPGHRRHKRRQTAAKGSRQATAKSPLVTNKTVASKDSLEEQAQAAKATSSPSTPPPQQQQQAVKVTPVPATSEATVRSSSTTATGELPTTSTKEPPAPHEAPPQAQPQAPQPPPSSLPVSNQPQIHLAKSQPQPSQQAPPVPEPPRINFETTGSIFGDRKRSHANPNLLQLENGRFRSPGLSKTIMGPNGRMIRVSFVSGFPSIKSIESRSSLTTVMSKVHAKKSVDSTKSHENQKQEDDMGLKKTKSVKSYKSAGSRDGNELQ